VKNLFKKGDYIKFNKIFDFTSKLLKCLLYIESAKISLHETYLGLGVVIMVKHKKCKE